MVAEWQDAPERLRARAGSITGCILPSRVGPVLQAVGLTLLLARKWAVLAPLSQLLIRPRTSGVGPQTGREVRRDVGGPR